MKDKRNLIIALLIIAVAVLAFLFLDQSGPPQPETANNQNISEPPPPAPTPAPTLPPDETDETDDSGETEEVSEPFSEKFADNNWLLIGATLGGQAVDMNVNVPKPLTLNFDKGDKSYGGHAGCNSFGGHYTASAPDKFSFGATTSTKIFCQATSDLENRIFQAMDQAAHFAITPQGNLVIRSADGQAKLEYKPAI